MDELKQLEEIIEKLRINLYKIVQEKGLNDDEVIKANRKLNHFIVQYHRCLSDTGVRYIDEPVYVGVNFDISGRTEPRMFRHNNIRHNIKRIIQHRIGQTKRTERPVQYFDVELQDGKTARLAWDLNIGVWSLVKMA
ncbi:spo0e like sporulation regulatory protein [Lucifera butyrica]|uniref:Spo0e like sporulation regulatory protein n=1 Tax=Lucifera butyrica TaxID=1351585 RepID=A0A498R666_9FIRM|nr:aspartyl-phosphate phosphatase Spo0E family protein [Lucifera butyrica]VBB08246.1 spo0e like sporulation regulatory protein [Lucifera butyrica]